ncbi:MAG: Grx4 family monothiol glutaredoxin [Alphaproteobacteria bacterium]|jgi:monothiol glutaredoxin
MSEITILDEIKNAVDSTDVLLFMKGSPQFPQCGFSSTVCQILNQLGIEFKSVDVLQNAEVRDGIKQFSSWPTIPQLYVKGEFLGGCDIVREMYESGELADFLTEKGVAVSA